MIAVSFNSATLGFLFLIIYIIRLPITTIIKKEKLHFKNEVKIIILFTYSWMLISATLFPIIIPPVGDNYVEINYNVLELFQYSDIRLWVYNVIGNIVLFVPMYFCIDINYKSLTGRRMFIVALLVSVLIEGLQYVENISGIADFTSRVTDINDVILNTLGGMIGWLLYETYKRLRIKE